MSKIDLAFSFMALSLLFTMQGGSCGNKEVTNKTPVEKNDRLAAGTGGGEHIRLEVTDSGAEIEYDCASSTIDQAVVLDSEGKFDVTGKYIREHAGPVRRDEELNGQAVRYTGHVKGKVMTLTVTISDTKEALGTYTLTHGSPGRVMKCR